MVSRTSVPLAALLFVATSGAPGQVSIAWREGTPLPLGTCRAASGLIGGRIYIFGGQGVPSVVHWAYDIAADSWITELAPMPGPSSNSRGVVYNGELYVLGGFWLHNALLRKYDPVLDTWFILSSPPRRATVFATGAAAAGDRLYYYCGQWDDGAVTRELWEYDPARDTWRELAPAPAVRAYGASASDGDYCYWVGGYSGELKRECYRYSVSADSWETLPNYPVRVFFADGDFLRGHLFIAGGGSSFSGITELRQVYCWTEGGEWDSAGFLPDRVGTPQVELTTHNDTDYIFVMGGTRDRVVLNTMYVGVITGLRPAGTEVAPASGRLAMPPATVVRGVLRLRDCHPVSAEETGGCTQPILLDIAGRKVMDLQPGENDVRHLVPGVYFLKEHSAFGSQYSGRSAVAKVIVAK